MTSELERECAKAPRVTIEATYGRASEYRPDVPNNWRVTLRHQGRRLTVDFYGGSAVYDITAADVLSSLMLDAEAGAQSFEDFCADFGYDEDSRKAEQTWRACRDTGPKVRRLLGASWDRFHGLEH